MINKQAKHIYAHSINEFEQLQSELNDQNENHQALVVKSRDGDKLVNHIQSRSIDYTASMRSIENLKELSKQSSILSPRDESSFNKSSKLSFTKSGKIKVNKEKMYLLQPMKKMGGLGSNTGTEDWSKTKGKSELVREFSKKINSVNIDRLNKSISKKIIEIQ